jgi:hypothetical protein
MLPGMIESRTGRSEMNRPQLWGPSAVLAVSTISLIVALGGRSGERTPLRECEEWPSDRSAPTAGQVSTFDRLIWGRGQEPVIEHW